MREVARRSIAFVSAIVLLASWNLDACGLHTCPHHSLVPSAPQGAHAAHAAHRVSHEHSGTQSNDEHGPCTCLGRCVQDAVGTPLPAHGIAVATIAFETRPVASPEQHPRPRVLRFLLPEANGPPIA